MNGPTATESSENSKSTTSSREQRRANILDAARRIFVDKGYEATAMAEIAQAAGLAVGTLYKFYKDKRDLYQTLVADLMHQFERVVCAALREPPDDEIAQLHNYLDVASRMFHEHLPVIRVYFAETGAAFLFPAGGLEDEAFKSYGRMVEAIEQTFRRGIAKGRFVDIDPKILALGLEGVHNAYLTRLVRDATSYSPEEIAANTKRVFFDAIARKTADITTT